MQVRYPNDYELARIKQWPVEDYHGLMKFVYDLWEFKERGWEQDGEIYTLITSGWSGNEDLIGAMRENFLFWAIYWESSTRGGKHVFYPLTLINMQKHEAAHVP